MNHELLKQFCAAGFAALLAGAVTQAADTDADLRAEAARALRRGVEFFRHDVSIQGGYLWQYSEDLSKREGEGQAPATCAWVQPPGTPAVGIAFLVAYDATQDAYYLEAAKETAYALLHGQLQSGGWAYRIDFEPGDRAGLAYRDGGKKKARNYTILDDNTTQSAIRFLMRTDRALGFKDARIHEAVRYALQHLLAAQFPNGAWPQVFDQPPEPSKYPVKPAAYPDPGVEAQREKNYHRFYTLNDNVLADIVAALFDAERIYAASDDTEAAALAAQCRRAAERAGDFILLAQMPEPQPAWAQQYDFDMHPVWARKFEPPAITGGESQGILRTLLRLYVHTGDRKYLEPIPKALAYLRRSRLPDGRLARFYELRTNRPLYFTKDYQLTFSDADMPTHYSFKVDDGTESIAREHERLSKLSPAQLQTEAQKDVSAQRPRPGGAPADAKLTASVKRIIADQDARGRWVEDGRLRYFGPDDDTRRIIRCETFIRNVQTLSRYLARTPAAPAAD